MQQPSGTSGLRFGIGLGVGVIGSVAVMGCLVFVVLPVLGVSLLAAPFLLGGEEDPRPPQIEAEVPIPSALVEASQPRMEATEDDVVTITVDELMEIVRTSAEEAYAEVYAELPEREFIEGDLVMVKPAIIQNKAGLVVALDGDGDGERDSIVWFPRATRRSGPFSLLETGDRVVVEGIALGQGDGMFDAYDGVAIKKLEANPD